MDVRLPKPGEGADSGTVVNIMVKPGDVVQAGQTILEIENEKAVAPIPAPSAGRVASILVQEGQKISVGQILLTLEPETSARPAAAAPAAPVVPPVAAPRPVEGGSQEIPIPIYPEGTEMAAPAAPSEPARDEAQPETGYVAGKEEARAAPPGVAAPASPSIRKLARELGLDLTKIRGSERGGRIVMADVRAYIQRLQQLAHGAPAAAPQAPPAAKPLPVSLDFSQWGPITKRPMSALRRTIRRRMVESWTTIPHVTQFDEADITTLLEIRKKFGASFEAKGARLTLTPFILKAVVHALRQFPIFNSSLDEATHEIVFKEYYNIGIAVDTETGLIVPVIRDVDHKEMFELAQDLQVLAEKTRARKVAPEDLKGGTFTISNQGGIGGAHFTPIINKPEVAILGLGRSLLKPVIREQQVLPRMMLPLCLSYDHRVIDGGDAARFITQLVAALESFDQAEVQMGTLV